MTAEEFKAKWQAKFPDNNSGEISEADFREFTADISAFGGTMEEFTTSQVFSIPAGENLSGLSALQILKKYSSRGFRQASAYFNAFPLLEKGATNTITVAGGINLNDVANSQLSVRMLKKDGQNWASFSTNAFSYTDTVQLTTTYLVVFDVNMPGGTMVPVSASAQARCLAPTFHGVSADEFVLEAEVKAATKIVVEHKGDLTLSFSADNAHAFLFEPKSHGKRNRILDQNGFDVTRAFDVIERIFTLKENTNPEGQPSNAITEPMYGYIKKQPAGNGSAFTYTFHNS